MPEDPLRIFPVPIKGAATAPTPELQKMQMNPAKPDITGSLRELQRVVSERKNAPEEVQADG